MNKRFFLLLTVLPSLSLASCVSSRHAISDYVLEMDYANDFRILQITDLHLGDKDDIQRHFDFMDLTINEANPDLIAVTGDLFTYASKGTARRLLDYFDSHSVPWTVIFGNHDEQCYFSIDWLTDQLNNYGSHCLFKDIQDDDVHGNCNFAINLKKDGKVFEQLIFMDSNRYYFGSYFGYDYFKQNQIDWYASLIDETTRDNGGTVVPSLMFYHIPLPEVNEAWAAAEKDPSLNVNGGSQGENPCNPEFNSGFFQVIKEKGSTKGMYFGHDHVNNYIVNYQGIDFGYGIKATDRVYYQDSLLGGRVISLHDDNTMSYQDYYHTYAEVK
ncbi:MAG: metallophosphoesterase [Bacilli bacterium]|nr:metallophosphoesterase [Bacilli bacterium]